MSNITGSSMITKTENYVEAEIDGETVLMHIDSGKFFSLSDTSRRAWEMIGDGVSFVDLTAAMMKEYQVAKDTCETELRELLVDLQERTLVDIG